MPAAPLPEDLVAWISAARTCVLATVRPDGQPVSLPCWYDYEPEDGRVILSMGRDARRVEHIAEQPRVALTILGEDWYTHVSLLGRVTEVREDTDLVDLDRLSMRYLGIPYFEREPCVTALVEIDRWHTFGLPVPPTQ
jgi:PPOX class probable F420-dependent enzyme